jgi:hypothetical protein
MKIITITSFFIFYFIGITLNVNSQDINNKIRIYDHIFDPYEHPDYWRKYIKPPNWETFNNETQFITLRDLEGNYKKKLDDCTIKYGPGNVLWPPYTTLFLKNIDSIIDEINKRDLFLFDIWGYVPGSGPGGYWQQFRPPAEILKKLNTDLDMYWLGMDNGEQDGRYIGGYANQLFPTGQDRKHQYFNFQNHFESLCNELGNKMATLVSLNFGHYFLKEGIYTMIGAETGQALPNAQIYYSFIRGASKQYGVPWFGNASVWNRWGYKSYSVDEKYNGGPTKGTSLNLLKRLLYSHIFYNCMVVGFESGFLNEGKPGSIGEIQYNACKWNQKFGQPGNMITQVALMLDFYSGWASPRHLYTSDIYKVWGNLPYQPGDYFTNSVLDMFYPGYQNSSYFHNETGFNVSTPYGDVVDCILSDCPLWLMKQYPIIVLAGDINCNLELNDKLEEYVKSGGHLIVTSSNLSHFKQGLCGILSTGRKISYKAGETIYVKDKGIEEKCDCSTEELEFPDHTEIIAECENKPVAVRLKCGKGYVTALASNFGIPDVPSGLPVSSEIDKELINPFPLLNHVQIILHDIFNSQIIFKVGNDLSYIIDRKSPGEYNILICNNTLKEKPFHIESRIGPIISTKESPLKNQEEKAIGYLPEGFENSRLGSNSKTTIAGGAVRIFNVKINEDILVIPFEKPVQATKNRFLVLHETKSIKEEILSRPTFFQHFNGVVIDWKYLDDRSMDAIKNEAGWINRQKLSIIVDFTSGLNLFPDLRLVNNDSIAYSKSIKTIENVIDKATLLECKNVILSLHRMIENNFTQEEFDSSFSATIREIGVYAKTKGIDLHIRLSMNKSMPLNKASEILSDIKSDNLYLSPGLPFLRVKSSFMEYASKVISDKIKLIFLSSPEYDLFGQLYNENAPLFLNENKSEIVNLIETFPKAIWIFDGNYNSWDDEYKDVNYFNRMMANF